MPPPHPLRRVSTGSLSALARSQDRAPHTSPSGLDFLAPALTELADEAATLAANTQKLNELHDALGTFNEAFAGWLYALKMNAFCVEWPEAPDANSFGRMSHLDTLLEQQRQLSLIPDISQPPSSSDTVQTSYNDPEHNPQHQQIEADMTYATASSFDDPPPAKGPPKSAMKKTITGGMTKKAGSGPGSAAMRKKRELEIAGFIDMLPLEYRGREPAMRLGMEKVIGMLMSNPTGLPMKEIVSPPELPQTKANKHLIALVAKKLVVKAVSEGQTVYRWIGA